MSITAWSMSTRGCAGRCGNRSIRSRPKIEFRLLGLHPGSDFSVRAAASLAGTTPARARRLLEELARAGLLTEQAPGRFGCHDLLHAYAIERAATMGSASARHAALGRLLDYYLHTAAAADRLLYPQALAWLDAEHRGLVAAVTLAAGHGFDACAWQLAFSLETFFHRRSQWDDWASTQRTALEAASRLGDRHAQALAHCGIASAQTQAGCADEALTHLDCALQLLEEAADVPGQARVHLYAGAFVAAWRGARDYLRSQPGYIDTVLHQSITPDAEFQFGNVAHCQTAEDFIAATQGPGFRESAADLARCRPRPRPLPAGTHLTARRAVEWQN